MVHPDYQYDPRLVTAMAGMVASGIYDMVLGSRILGSGALRGGMPLWKYVANRLLTLFENMLLGANLSEYHTGLPRLFARRCSTRCRWQRNSDDFVFDNQILAQAIVGGLRHRRGLGARRATSPRPARSASGARCATASASSGRRCSRSWRATGIYRHRLFELTPGPPPSGLRPAAPRRHARPQVPEPPAGHRRPALDPQFLAARRDGRHRRRPRTTR